MAYNARAYGRMLADPLRKAAFVSAMTTHIKPDSVVLDLGAGSGILSLLACRLGAAKVYAVDPNPLVWLLAEGARANGFADRVEILCGDSREVDIGRVVNVIIADIRGPLPLVGGSFDVVADACKRFLKPGGVVLPQMDRMFLAPVSEHKFMSDWKALWASADLGIDISALGRAEFGDAVRSQAGCEDFLAEPQLWGTFHWAPRSHIEQAPELCFEIVADGELHGFIEWFDLDFGDDVVLTNAPGEPDLVYGRASFLLSDPVHVKKGYKVSVALRVHPLANREIWTWAGKIRDAQGALVGSFSESTLKATSVQLLAKSMGSQRIMQEEQL